MPFSSISKLSSAHSSNLESKSVVWERVKQSSIKYFQIHQNLRRMILSQRLVSIKMEYNTLFLFPFYKS